MLRAFVLYLLRLLNETLEPDLKARVEAARNKAAALEAEREQILKDIEASQARLLELTQVFTDNQRRELELKNAIAHTKAEAERKKAELDRLSDRDLLRRGL